MPQWMLERNRTGDNSVTQSLIAGYQLAQADEQQKRQAMLQTMDMTLRRRADEIAFEKHIIEKHDALEKFEDASELQRAMKAFHDGNPDVEPKLRTLTALRTWQTFKGGQRVAQAETAEWDTFTKSLSGLDGHGIAAVRAVGDLRPGAILPEHYQILGNESKRVAEEAAALKMQYRTIDVDGTKFLQAPTGGIRAVPQDWSGKVEASEVTDAAGNILGHAVPNSRGGVTILRTPTTKRHPLQNKLDGLKAELAGEKAANHTMKAKALQAEVEALEKAIGEDQAAPASQPSASPATNAPPNVLRYDPTTGTFR